MTKGAVMRRFSIALVPVGVLGAASAPGAVASGWSLQRAPAPRWHEHLPVWRRLSLRARLHRRRGLLRQRHQGRDARRALERHQVVRPAQPQPCWRHERRAGWHLVRFWERLHRRRGLRRRHRPGDAGRALERRLCGETPQPQAGSYGPRVGLGSRPTDPARPGRGVPDATSPARWILLSWRPPSQPDLALRREDVSRFGDSECVGLRLARDCLRGTA